MSETSIIVLLIVLCYLVYGNEIVAFFSIHGAVYVTCYTRMIIFFDIVICNDIVISRNIFYVEI